MIHMRVIEDDSIPWLRLGWRVSKWGAAEVVGGNRIQVMLEHDEPSPLFPCLVCEAPISELDWIVLKICGTCEGGLL